MGSACSNPESTPITNSSQQQNTDEGPSPKQHKDRDEIVHVRTASGPLSSNTGTFANGMSSTTVSGEITYFKEPSYAWTNPDHVDKLAMNIEEVSRQLADRLSAADKEKYSASMREHRSILRKALKIEELEYRRAYHELDEELQETFAKCKIGGGMTVTNGLDCVIKVSLRVKRYGHTYHEAEIEPHDTYDFGARNGIGNVWWTIVFEPRHKQWKKCAAQWARSNFSHFEIVPKNDSQFRKTEVRRRVHFENAGHTVSRTPNHVVDVKTVEEIQECVKTAIAEKRLVRCTAGSAAEAQSHSDIHCDDGHCLINTRYLCNMEDRKAYQIDDPRSSGSQTFVVDVPAGTTTGQFAAWCKQNSYSIPFDVSLDCATVAGVVQTGCHGSGWSTSSHPDLVYKLEVVNSSGELQTLDFDLVRRGAGVGLGLWGVVHSVTLFLEPMQIVRVSNQVYHKMELFPKNSDDFSLLSSLVTSNDSIEITGFPWVDECHVMTHNRGEAQVRIDDDRIPNYDGFVSRIAMELLNFYTEVLNTCLAKDSKAHHVFSKLGFSSLPRDAVDDDTGEYRPYIVPLPNALHWRSHTGEVTRSSMEFAFPVQKEDQNEPDFTRLRDLWHMTFDKLVDARRERRYPIDGPIRLKFTGGSACVMSPARRNIHTVWIEVTSGAKNELFYPFCTNLARTWMDFEACALPHWGRWSPIQAEDERQAEYFKVELRGRWTPIQAEDERQAEYFKVELRKRLYADIETMTQAREDSGVDRHNIFANFHLANFLELNLPSDLNK